MTKLKAKKPPEVSRVLAVEPTFQDRLQEMEPKELTLVAEEINNAKAELWALIVHMVEFLVVLGKRRRHVPKIVFEFIAELEEQTTSLGIGIPGLANRYNPRLFSSCMGLIRSLNPEVWESYKLYRHKNLLRSLQQLPVPLSRFGKKKKKSRA